MKINGAQLSILAERYLDIILADRGNTFLLMIQAPIIALCIVLVWRDFDVPTNSLYFVMALSAVWFGTMNACREIVKERPILERELRVGLNLPAYVVSKFLVLAALGIFQCLLLVFFVNRSVPLPGGAIFHFATMVLASLGGTGLGLMLSSLMSTSDRAVGAVPIVLLPQILFSDQIVSHEHSTKLILWLEDLTLTKWSYEGMKQLAKTEPSWLSLFQSSLALSLMSLFFLLLCGGLLRWQLRDSVA